MFVTREMVMEALLDLLKENLPGFKTFSRRFITYDRISMSAQCPYLVITSGQENYSPRESIRLPAKREMQVEITIYLSAGQDQTTIPDQAVNTILDNIDEALAPIPPQEAQTLGGLVNHCYIEGDILKVPGDLDGIGVIVIPIKILLP